MSGVEITFTVKTRWVSGDADDVVDRDEVVKLVTEYLMSTEGPFREDYGPDAWGGYDGPFVTDVHVEAVPRFES